MTPEPKFIKLRDVLTQTVKERRLRTIENNCIYWVKQIDDVLKWFTENELIVIGAWSWVSKTELSNQIAIANAMRGKKVALFSLEWDIWEIIYRLLQQRINLNKTDWSFVSGPDYRLNMIDINDEEDIAMSQIDDKILDNILVFDKSFIPTRETLLAMIASLHNKVDMYVIDHLHYLDYGADEKNWLSDIIRWVKETTEILRKPVVMVAHLSRTYITQKRDPTKSDLHWSSNIEKNANTIILLTKGEWYQAIEEHKDSAHLAHTKIIIDKCRTWIQLPVKLDWVFDIRTKLYRQDKEFCQITQGNGFSQVRAY